MRRSPYAVVFFLGLLCALSSAASSVPIVPAPIVPVPTPSLQGVPAEARAKVEEARLDLEARRAEGRPMAEAFGVLGARYLHVGALGAAQVALENAIGLGPEDFQWRYYLAVTHERLGDLESAAAQLREVLEIREGNLATVLRLADVAARLDAVDESRRLYDKALQSTLGAAAARAGLARLAERGEGEDGSTRSDGAEVNIPDPLMQQLALELGDPGTPPGPRVSADSPRGTSAPATALTELEEASTRLDPEGAEAHFSEIAGSVEVPAELRAGAFFYLGQLRQDARRIEEAVVLYRRALDVHPGQGDALFNLGVILASNDRHGEAIELYRRLFELQPDYEGLRLRFGVSLMRSGQAWPALGHFEALLRSEPDHVEALVSSAVLLDRVGEGGQARGRLQAAAERLGAPADLGRVLAALGGIERRGGDTAAGLDSLRRAVKAFDAASTSTAETSAAAASAGLATAHRDLARALAGDGLYAEADRHFAAYLDVEPGDAGAHFARAMALILDDRDARARDVLRAATAELSDLSLIHLYARLLAGSTDASVRSGERAVEIATAVFKEKRSPQHGETLAMAYAAAGRFEEALTLQRTLLDQARAADFDAGFIGRVERNLTRYRAGQPGVFGW
ncbi:MAG: tetratricopeptide repeat protein [Acidobacteriota bacterium]